jgi:hypothetical protein
MSDISSTLPITPADPSAAAVPEPAQETVERDYAVYELPDHNDKMVAPKTMVLVGLVSAESKDAARWAAVDANPTLKDRVSAVDGESGEQVVLLPIALRSLGGATPTFEEVERVTARR